MRLLVCNCWSAIVGLLGPGCIIFMGHGLDCHPCCEVMCVSWLQFFVRQSKNSALAFYLSMSLCFVDRDTFFFSPPPLKALSSRRTISGVPLNRLHVFSYFDSPWLTSRKFKLFLLAGFFLPHPGACYDVQKCCVWIPRKEGVVGVCPEHTVILLLVLSSQSWGWTSLPRMYCAASYVYTTIVGPFY